MCWGAQRGARQGPHTVGASGRGGSKENHPGLNRNSISQALHGAAPGGECTLKEPLHIPMAGFGLGTASTGSPTVTSLCTTTNFKSSNNEKGVFSVRLRSSVLLQGGNPLQSAGSRQEKPCVLFYCRMSLSDFS